MDLTTRQIAHLRSLAQSLRPQLQVGMQGYTPSVLSALEDLFRGRELVKARVLKTSPDSAREIAEQVARAANAVLVGVVGSTFVLYRPNPELKDRIELPDAAPKAAEAPQPRRARIDPRTLPRKRSG